ncbi:hypothetical protein IJF81_00485, partial [bacterium]|nr:hypothetical protein [bacterium]
IPANIKDFSLIEKYLSLASIKIDPDIQKSVFKIFPLYIDQMSRMDVFYKACYHDYVNHFNLMFRFLYRFMIAEKIDVVFMTSYPHHGIDLLLIEVAKLLNIKTIFTLANYESETFIPVLHYSDTMDPDKYYHLMTKKQRDSHVQIPKCYEKELHYMKNVKPVSEKPYRYGFNTLVRIYLAIMLVLKRYNSKIVKRFVKRMNLYYKVRNSLAYEKKYIKPVDLSQKYVYFGLHLQPEYTTSFWGKEYIDQLLAIEHLAYVIPGNWKIYVKENPKQVEFQRHPLFYERLHMIEKAVLVPNDTNTYELIKNSQFCASISGTMLYEAVSGGKPAVIFGRHWYENLPGVFRFNKNLDIEKVVNYKINHQELEQTVRKFFETAYECVQEEASLEPAYREENNKKYVAILLEALHR